MEGSTDVHLPIRRQALKIERVSELQNHGPIGVVRSFCLVENQEQIISRLVDPVQSEIETEKILNIVVLKRGTGEPIIGKVVIDADVAQFGGEVSPG